MIILMMVDTPEQKRKFAELYERYRYLMFKIAVDILHEHHLAEDALQEAFVRVAKHMECIGQLEETATKRYLITITKNAAIDLYRKQNNLRSREIYVDELADNQMPLDYMEPEADSEVLDILKNLPPKACGIREGTVRQRLARGRQLIAEELEKIKKGEV